MSRKQYQQQSSTTTKVHFKLYKSGKLWLVSGVTTLSLLTGLTLVGMAPVHAATTSTDDPTAESSSQNANTQGTVPLKSNSGDSDTSSLENNKSNTPPETTSEDSKSNPTDSAEKKVPESNNGDTDTSKDGSVTNNNQIPNTPKGSDPADAPSKNNDQSGNPAPTNSIDNSNPDSTLPGDKSTEKIDGGTGSGDVDSSNFLVSQNDIKTDSLFKSFSVEDLSISDDSVDTLADEKVPATTVAAPTLNYAPIIGNFYVTVDGATSYALYGATASVSVQPYSTTNYKTNPITGDQQLWGFYIILPNGVTANLADFKTSASTFLADLNKDGYINNLTSIDVYQLKNTSPTTTEPNGREVFYFRPNDGAVISSQSSPNGTKLHLLITTPPASSSIKSVTINADIARNFDSTTGQMTKLTGEDQLQQAVQNDILFYGQSNTTTATPTYYKALSWQRFSSDSNNPYPDDYLVGTAGYANGLPRTDSEGNPYFILSEWAKTLNYISAKAEDTYNVINKDTGLTSTFHTTGLTGSNYDPISEIMANTVYKDPQNYQFSLSQDTFTAVPTNAVYNPTVADVSTNDLKNVTNLDDLTMTGQTYTVYVSPIQTKLSTKKGTKFVAGAANRWDPNNTLVDALDENGQPISVGNGVVMTDKDGAPVSVSDPSNLVDTTKAGTYTVYYAYTDSQGTKATAHATITVLPNSSTLSVLPSSELTTSGTWDPTANLTGYSDTSADSKPTDSVTDAAALAQALADGTIKVAYSYQKSAGGPATASNSVDPKVPGIYTVTYTYTDSNGQAITATSIVTVKAPATSGSTTPDPGTTTATDPVTSKPSTPTTKPSSKPGKPWRNVDSVTKPTIKTTTRGKVTALSAATSVKKAHGLSALTTGNSAAIATSWPIRAAYRSNNQAAKIQSTSHASQNESTDNTMASQSGNAQTTLPQTSDAHSWLSYLGLASLSLLGFISFRRKQD